MTEDTDHAQVLVPPPAVFVGYLLCALLLNWLVPLRSPWVSALRAVGGVLVVAGVLLDGAAFRAMMKAGTSPDALRPTTTMVTDGPYRRTRNPIYVGFFLIYLGFTLLAGTLWGVLLSPFLFVTMNRAIVEREEVYLERKFGAQYAEYKSRVRRWL